MTADKQVNFLRKTKFRRPRQLPWVRGFWPLAIAILLIVLSWIGLQRAGADLTTRSLKIDGVPMRFMATKTATSVPGVLIAHGYCGSKQLMLGYAYTLAHNGYGVLLWDLPGHGANTHPFEYDSLQSSFEVPFAALKAQPEIDPNQLAVIGHSMGSGIAMEGAIAYDDELDAVIAISPTGAPVTSETPKNLSLQIGEWESFLFENANRLLEAAGGENPNLERGKGRSLSVIQNAEHATILFKDQSHQEALAWLNQTFGLNQASPFRDGLRPAFRDRRMGWYGMHLLGWLMVLGIVLPKLQSVDYSLNQLSTLRSWGGLAIAPLIGTTAFKVMNLAVSVEHLGRLMIGGALGVWFLTVGLVWLGMTAKLPRLRWNDVLIGLVGFVGLWLGFGAMAQVVWLPWFLTLPRLLLWGLIAIACIPWFLASSIVQENASLRLRLGWWIGQSVAVIVGLILAIVAVPDLGFLAIMLPAFPVLFGIFSFLSLKSKSIWGCALACAPIFSWLIVVPFPTL